jgi:type VI secretion system protein ImpE
MTIKTDSLNSLNTQLTKGSLNDFLTVIENDIKSNPAEVTHRWLLFTLLCIFGDWVRAKKTLTLCVNLDKNYSQAGKLYTRLIDSEISRENAFNVGNYIGFTEHLPPWGLRLAEALQHEIRGEKVSADKVRLLALEQMNSEIANNPISSALGSCKWMVDSDTRLSGVCEMIGASGYKWLPFSRINRIDLAHPNKLLDLIWLPAKLSVKDANQTITKDLGNDQEFVYLQTRYPFMKNDKQSDSLLLARETHWLENGTTSVRGKGQKTYMTDIGDWSILELEFLENLNKI